MLLMPPWMIWCHASDGWSMKVLTDAGCCLHSTECRWLVRQPKGSMKPCDKKPMGPSASIWASSMMTRVSGRELMLVNPTFTTHRLTQWCMKRCSVQRETKRLRKHLITLKLQHITRVSRSLASLHGCLGGDNYGQH